jgi:hypothetical protein
MESFDDAKRMILREITTDDPDVRASFLKRYTAQAERFAGHMAQAMLAWRQLAAKVDEHPKLVFVVNIVYCAIALHIQSVKLFLSGQIVAAGNLTRQVLEAIATALLSSGKELDVLDRFVADQYSTKNAVRHVLRKWEKLNLLKPGVAALAEAEEFYHLYSHMSKMTVASVTSFAENALYVGASFDEGKLDAYDKEMQSRVDLAAVFPNFVEAVTTNVGKW